MSLAGSACSFVLSRARLPLMLDYNQLQDQQRVRHLLIVIVCLCCVCYAIVDQLPTNATAMSPSAGLGPSSMQVCNP